MKGWNYKIDQSWNVMSYQWIHDIIDTQFISEKNTLSRNILFNESSPYEGLMREIFIPNCFDIETKLICEAINPEIAKSVYLKSTHLNLDETMIGFWRKRKENTWCRQIRGPNDKLSHHIYDSLFIWWSNLENISIYLSMNLHEYISPTNP